MIGSSVRHAAAQRGRLSPGGPLALFLMVGLSIATVVWGVAFITARPSLELEEYLLLTGAFGLASAGFVIPRLKANSAQFFDFPVFITITVFLRFAIVPIDSFFHLRQLTATSTLDPALLPHALFLVAIGMVAFWYGSSVGRPKKNPTRGAESSRATSSTITQNNSVLIFVIILVLVGQAARLYLLVNHLYSYTASSEALYQHLALVQVLAVVSEAGTCALLLAAIEKYGHPSDASRRVLFYVVLGLECIWALISGYKGVFLWNLLLVVIVASRIRQRLRVTWLIGLPLMLIVFYPISNQYRNLIHGGEMGDVTSLGSAQKIGAQAMSDTIAGTQGMNDWFSRGMELSLQRLDALQTVGAVLYLGSLGDSLRTRGHWWMLPFFPFIPRFIWTSKPIEDVGLKLTVRLGGPPTANTSITHPGDAYLEFGLPGVIICMFVLGIVSEWLTRLGSGTLNKRRLFVFVSIFSLVVDMEVDVFAYWTGLIRWLVVSAVIAWVVYRPRAASVRTPVSTRRYKPSRRFHVGPARKAFNPERGA